MAAKETDLSSKVVVFSRVGPYLRPECAKEHREWALKKVNHSLMTALKPQRRKPSLLQLQNQPSDELLRRVLLQGITPHPIIRLRFAQAQRVLFDE